MRATARKGALDDELELSSSVISRHALVMAALRADFEIVESVHERVGPLEL